MRGIVISQQSGSEEHSKTSGNVDELLRDPKSGFIYRFSPFQDLPTSKDFFMSTMIDQFAVNGKQNMSKK